MIRKAGFIFRLAGQDLRANATVHLVAAAIIAAAFLTVGVFILIAVNLRALANHWEKKIQVCVYLLDTVTSEQQAAMIAKLQALPAVAGVNYVSKDQAMDDFKVMLGHNAGLLEGLNDNPLPASLVVDLRPQGREVAAVKKLAAAVSAWPGVEEVDYGGAWLEGFSSAVKMVTAAVAVIGALIVLAIVFIISNTIRLTMYSRKDEIGIMKLVGASNLLIRLPFVLEGMVSGVAAAALGVVTLWVLYRVGLAGFAWPGVFAGFAPVFLSGPHLAYLILAGAGLGAAASMSRFSDFLRV